MGREAYESAWHHPGAAWAGAVLLVVWLVVGGAPRRARTLGAVLAGMAALDAWATGPFSPVPPGTGYATAASVAFVILGDARFVWLVARQVGRTAAPRSRPADTVLSLGVAAAVPLTAYAATRVFPHALPTPRHLFLVHELLFVLLAAACLAALRRGPFVGSPSYARRLARFELAQYAGWALCDVLLLATAADAPGGGGRLGDLAWALRIGPNVAYYALFAAAASLALPDEART